jgi:hypothetical protein
MSAAMPAHYWIAKYIEDPFRNESRNIGVIVTTPEGLAARFAGEREDGTVDGRRLQSFKYAEVYKQWLQYWREQLEAENIDGILGATTENYRVVPGGEVSDTGSDGAEAVCKFLYGLLVSDAPVLEAFDLAAESDTERDLSLDVDIAFREWDILADQPTLAVRHPVRRKHPVRGEVATHEPSFSQRNGKLYLFEAIDFNSHKPKLLKERAGFMAYMFSDIRHREHSNGMEAYSIVRPKVDGDGDAIEYARSMLAGESKILNWADPQERDQFLRERRAIAESLAGAPRWTIQGQSGPTGPSAPPISY